MIYRCRWCERGYCEDCLDFSRTTILGDNLKEYEILGFPEVAQAFYISCPSCADRHAHDLTAKHFCDKKAKEYDTDYEQFFESESAKAAMGEEDRKAMLAPSRASSLTDATTLDDSGLSTPQVESADGLNVATGRKRKGASSKPSLQPYKRQNAKQCNTTNRLLVR